MSQFKKFVIDGYNFRNLKEFYDEIGDVLVPGVRWGHNLESLTDILKGDLGTPKEGFAIKWINSKLSIERLGEERFNIIVEIIKKHEEEFNVKLELA